MLFSYSIGQLELNLNMAKSKGDAFKINTFSNWLSSRKSLLHRYTLSKYHELKYSAEYSYDIFARIRERVDGCISSLLPDSIKAFIVVYDGLKSRNEVDWSRRSSYLS